MTLNRKQRLIVILAACAIVLAMLFPPWLRTFDMTGSEGGHSIKPAGFSCIMFPPASESGRYASLYGVKIDTTRLLIECVCISVAFGVAFLFATVKPLPPKATVEHPPAKATAAPPVTLTWKPFTVEWCLLILGIQVVVAVVVWVVWGIINS